MATSTINSAPFVSKYAHLGVPNKEWEEYYEANYDSVPVLDGSPDHMRHIMAELKKRAGQTTLALIDGLDVRDEQMPTSDDASISLRIYTPIPSSGSMPAVIYIHGGGWTLGDLDGEDHPCRSMCIQASVVVISIDYRLAPEFPFPRGLEDSWEAVEWVIENAQRLLINPHMLLLAGSSSGANFTAVLSHRARDAGIPLRGQILRIPSVCHIEHYPPELNLRSMDELRDAPVLCKRSMELFYGNLKLLNPADPAISPLLSPVFKNLPPAYVQIAGLDPLRDEGFAYADKLRSAGVPVRVDVYAGLPHAFGYFPLCATKRYGQDVVQAVIDLINGTGFV